MLTSREVVLVKKEVTYNTDPVPTAVANAMLIGNPSWSHEGLRMNERSVVKNTNAVEQSVFGGTLKTISIDIELKGSGAAGTAPEFGVLFEACSYVETIDAGVSVAYDPSSTTADQESVTVYYYQDGLLHKLTGCRGTFSVNLETGAIPMATFTLTGHSVAPTDIAMVVPTLDSTVPVAVKGNAFTIGGYGADISALTFDAGVEVSTPASMKETDGFGEVFVGKRDLNGSFDPLTVLVATNDFYGDFLAGTQMALTIGTVGAVAGNKFGVTMPAVYYRDAANGDRDGIRTYEMPFGAVETTGDNEVQFLFT